MIDCNFYKPEELSNEKYHEIEGISGSGLSRIYQSSVEHYLSQEVKETDAMRLGTIIHKAILEPELFREVYACGLNYDDMPDDCIKGVTQMKSWLKEAGIKVSGSKSELIERILLADETVKIWDKIESDHEKLNEGKEIVQHGTYNDIRNMHRIFNSDSCNSALVGDGSLIEYSVIVRDDRGITLKGRPDIITSDGLVVNYKTCVDANPETFMNKAFKMGYVLRSAFEYDMASHILGEKPSGYMIVAQEKQAPFTVVRYVFGDAELEIGRQMYQSALDQYINYMETGVASSYPAEVSFTLPDYMYEDSLEIEL